VGFADDGMGFANIRSARAGAPRCARRASQTRLAVICLLIAQPIPIREDRSMIAARLAHSVMPQAALAHTVSREITS